MTDLSVSDLDAIHATWGADALEQVLSTGLSWAELGAVPRPERVDRFGPGASADLPAAAAPLPYTEATQHLVPSDGVPPWVGRSALRPPLLWAAGTFPDRPTVGFGGTNFPTDTGAVISAEGAVAVARQGVPVAAILGTELGHVVVSSALAVGGTVVAVLQTGIGAPAVSDRTIDQVVDAGGAVVSAEPFAGLMSSGSLERAERLMLSLSCALVAPEAGASDAAGAALLGAALIGGLPLFVPRGSGGVPLSFPRDMPDMSTLRPDVASVGSADQLLDELQARELLTP